MTAPTEACRHYARYLAVEPQLDMIRRLPYGAGIRAFKRLNLVEPQSTDPRSLKLIFQAVYGPELSYFRSALDAAMQLETDYPAWSRDANTDTRLIDYAHHCALHITTESLAYTQDYDDAKLAAGRIAKALEAVPVIMKIPSYRRLGLRRYVLVPVDMSFDSLAAVMTAKLYIQAKALREALPQRIDDLFYRIDGTEGDLNFHVTVAPVRREEIRPKIVDLRTTGTIHPKGLIDTVRRIEAGYPEVAIFFDIDAYRERDKIAIESAPGFLEDATQRIQRMVDQTARYLLDKSVNT